MNENKQEETVKKEGACCDSTCCESCGCDSKGVSMKMVICLLILIAAALVVAHGLSKKSGNAALSNSCGASAVPGCCPTSGGCK